MRHNRNRLLIIVVAYCNSMRIGLLANIGDRLESTVEARAIWPTVVHPIFHCHISLPSDSFIQLIDGFFFPVEWSFNIHLIHIRTTDIYIYIIGFISGQSSEFAYAIDFIWKVCFLHCHVGVQPQFWCRWK